jgi:hypothetical protein
MAGARLDGMHRVLALSMLLCPCLVDAGTNTVPPLIIRGVVDPNAEQWSPSSSWWLRPQTNVVHEAVAEPDGETNKVLAAASSKFGETNLIKEAEVTASDVGVNAENVTDFGASIGSGGPVGRPNVEMGQQSLQLGKTAAGLGPSNAQIGQGNNQLGGLTASGQALGKATTGIGQPNSGIGAAKP